MQLSEVYVKLKSVGLDRKREHAFVNCNRAEPSWECLIPDPFTPRELFQISYGQLPIHDTKTDLVKQSILLCDYRDLRRP